jgi:hypothetical protein
MLVEAGGRKLQAELRRVPGIAPRYALSIANDTALYLLVSFRARRGGHDRPIAPAEIWVDPNSTAEFSFNVAPLIAALGGSLVVRLVNTRMQRELVAPLPGSSWLLGAAGGAVAAGIVAALVAFAQPRIEIFAVPPVALSNGPLQVAYRTGGVGNASYALDDDRGKTIASGALRASNGTLALTLPPSARAANYTVHLRDAGALGIAEQAQPVTALPSATAPPVPLIEAMSVERSQINDGGAIDVHYRTAATRGRVIVRDDRNTVWAQAPLAHNGSARLQLPSFGSNRELRVTLEAARGREHASSTLGVSVVAAAPPPPPDTQVEQSFAAPPPVLVENQRVDPGSVLRAQIEAGASHVRLTLETLAGSTISAVTVPDGSTGAAIDVPRGAHGELVLVATYDVGAGEESIVRHISVGSP